MADTKISALELARSQAHEENKRVIVCTEINGEFVLLLVTHEKEEIVYTFRNEAEAATTIAAYIGRKGAVPTLHVGRDGEVTRL